MARRPRGPYARDRAMLMRLSPEERAIIGKAAAKLGLASGALARDAAVMYALRVIHGDERYSEHD